MLIKIITILMVLLGVSTLASCGGSSKAAVTGTVTYLQRIALPSDAVVTVRIEDVSKADAPPELIGEQVIKTRGVQVPIPFAVPYGPDKIEGNLSYSLRVRIEDGTSKLLFINDTSIPVITRGNPIPDIEIVLVPAVG